MATGLTANAANRERACSGYGSARPVPRCTMGCWRPRVGAGRKGGCHGDEYRADPSLLCGQQIPGDPGGAAAAARRVTGRWGAAGKGAGRRETGRGLRVVSAATWRGRGGRGRAGALRETRPAGREKTAGGCGHTISPRFRCSPQRRGRRLYGLSDLRLNLLRLSRKTRNTLGGARKS